MPPRTPCTLALSLCWRSLSSIDSTGCSFPNPQTCSSPARRQRLQIESLPYDERDAAHDVLLPLHHRDPVRSGPSIASDPARPDDRNPGPVDRTLSGPRTLAVMVLALFAVDDVYVSLCKRGA